VSGKGRVLTRRKLSRYKMIAMKENAKTVRHAEHPVQLTSIPGGAT